MCISDKTEICQFVIIIQLSCKKKECDPQKGQDEKRCEIQGGGQEMG